LPVAVIEIALNKDGDDVKVPSSLSPGVLTLITNPLPSIIKGLEITRDSVATMSRVNDIVTDPESQAEEIAVSNSEKLETSLLVESQVVVIEFEFPEEIDEPLALIATTEKV
jgi:hypothetical protein